MQPDDKEPVAEHILLLRALQEPRGWTQQQLANTLGVSSRTIRRWEHGYSEPHVSWLPRLRAILNESDITSDP
jgi:transcriptional regulator with XRE-family HTH domain